MGQLNFWSSAEANPARTAVVDPMGRQVSAGEVLAGSRRLANGLHARGLRPGDSVAAVLPNSVEALELYLAAVESGWYLVPINFHLVGPEIAHIVRDSEAKALVTHERFAEASAAAVAELDGGPGSLVAVGDIPGFTGWAELQEGQTASPPAERTIGRIMNYTSGTTGRPKGVRRPLPNAAPDEFVWTGGLQAYRLDPSQDHVHLCCTPWYHTAPMAFVGPAVHSGHQIVFMDKFQPEVMLEQIERHGVTYTLMVPTQFVRLLALPDEVRTRHDLSSLVCAIHGAAPCPPEVKRQMINWWGPVITEYYASTEGGGTVVFADEWLRKPGTVGRPFANAEIVIMDDSGERLPAGEVGTVYFRSAMGPVEYFKDPQKTAAASRSGYFTVGDVGYLDEEGYLFLCDRKTEMIISGGVNIYPAEVEAVLLAHPQVVDAAVFGIPNQEWGEEVKAVVEPKLGAEAGPQLAEEIAEFCRGRLARYKTPRSIDFVEEMPRDPSGKLYRRKLRDPYWAGQERRI